MNVSSVLKTICLIICLLLLLSSFVQGSIISGREPRNGFNVLDLDNSEGEYDAVAVLMEEGWPNPVCSIFIPAGDSYTLTKVPDGTYEIYYLLGKGWSNSKKMFTDLEKMGKIAQPIVMDTDFQSWDTNDYWYESGWVHWNTDYTIYTFTLYEVLGGDIPLEDVDPDDFPKM